ncbi:DnaA ATPase domain-containing protein [Kurthia sp. Dielmo]|uniref:DnaA ATPase domain-containing protein n=1 Tax=Kurthia sp. Dielmo TaxID=1033738 RepID=UPI001123CE83|nr:DnaA/Hda family protein [Kurthia sp. Dielmo]
MNDYNTPQIHFNAERTGKMQSIQDVLQSDDGPLRWDRDNYCDKHDSNFVFMPPAFDNSQCPMCGTEKLRNEFQDEMQKVCTDGERLRKHNILAKQSVIQDNTITNATFDNFIVQTDEEHTNKIKAIKAAERFSNGEAFNLWIQSPQTGCGKSHLAMSILKYVNDSGAKDKSTLFLDLGRTMELIKDSFNNKESEYTQNHFISLANSVDVLVIDDLGAETGDIYSDKRASEYTSNVLRSILNGRQDKATIITTNLTGARMITGYKDGHKFIPPMYDKKMMSRAMRNVLHIVFNETPDKRVGNLQF